MDDPIRPDRRRLFGHAAIGAAGLVAGPRLMAAPPLPGPSPVDTGQVAGGTLSFPPWRDPIDTPGAPTPNPLPPGERVGFAVVGLGRLATEQILPAFAQARQARCVALVSGSPDKLRLVAAQHGIAADACYDYAGFDRIRDDPRIQAVYIALPNALHRPYTERAAKAGKHVLTEKPMAATAADAQAMVDATRAANVLLMVAYRIQYEAYNRRMMELVRGGTLGRVLAISAVNTQTVAADGARQWRHKRALAGGGSLFDIGLYCLNTARFLLGEEPVEIFARTWSPPGDPRFAEVEESVAFQLRFPSHAFANCFCSYGGRDDKYQRINLARAGADMPNAYQYEGQRLALIRREGDATSTDQLSLHARDQFAAEIDHFADCIRHHRRPWTPGEEGVQDMKLMEAIYRSAAEGRPVALPPVAGLDRFRGDPPQPG